MPPLLTERTARTESIPITQACRSVPEVRQRQRIQHVLYATDPEVVRVWRAQTATTGTDADSGTF